MNARPRRNAPGALGGRECLGVSWVGTGGLLHSPAFAREMHATHHQKSSSSSRRDARSELGAEFAVNSERFAGPTRTKPEMRPLPSLLEAQRRTLALGQGRDEAGVLA